jgi:hypothetical protein
MDYNNSGKTMKWITRKNAKVDRIACPWLIQKYIDQEAEFIYVEHEDLLKKAQELDAISYDAPGAKYTHRDGKCTFEVLIEEFRLSSPALNKMARIVHGADIPDDLLVTPESAGLRGIAEGFTMTIGEDQEKLRVQFPMYDALYAWCTESVKS